MRSTALRTMLAATALLSLPASAWAHPGHGGSEGHGWHHWLFDHVLPVAAVSLIIVVAITVGARWFAKPARR